MFYLDIRNQAKKTENDLVRTKIVKDYFIFYMHDNEILTVVGFCDMRRDPKYIETLLR